jgi:hypothetical protein
MWDNIVPHQDETIKSANLPAIELLPKSIAELSQEQREQLKQRLNGLKASLQKKLKELDR